TATLALKADVTYVDNQLTFKANQTTTYTKTEVNDLLTPKATITYVDGQLELKASQLTTYTKTEVYTALGLKSNQLTTYTKTEVDTELAKKANISDMTVALAAKSDSTYVDAQLALKA
ncbi:MAG: hypothetical protein ACKPKO_60135, partial [Candidatus Fonsibacter sp.]